MLYLNSLDTLPKRFKYFACSRFNDLFKLLFGKVRFEKNKFYLYSNQEINARVVKWKRMKKSYFLALNMHARVEDVKWWYEKDFGLATQVNLTDFDRR
jgi:hypothetical protein